MFLVCVVIHKCFIQPKKSRDPKKLGYQPNCGKSDLLHPNALIRLTLRLKVSALTLLHLQFQKRHCTSLLSQVLCHPDNFGVSFTEKKN